MDKLIYLQIIAALICIKYAYGNESCDCLNPIYVETPKFIGECSSKFRFLDQVHQNYNKVYNSLLSEEGCKECDFSDYIPLVKGMQDKTEAIVEAYFSCGEDDRKPALMAAYNDYVDYYMNFFNIFANHCFIFYSPACVQTLMNSRPLIYGSPQNILTGLLTCAELRLESRCGGNQTPQLSLIQLIQMLFAPRNSDCYCIKLDPLPFPSSEQECVCEEYISKLKNFVTMNFAKVKSVYSDAQNCNCSSYTDLEGYITEIHDLTEEATCTLERTIPTSAQLSTYLHRFDNLRESYSPLVREYILNNEKECYFRVRKARHYPMAIVDGVFGMITKCIAYRDNNCQN